MMAQTTDNRPAWECRACREAWNALNGRWCGKLWKYVEYDFEPKCLEAYEGSPKR